jgi:hypothetical protein
MLRSLRAADALTLFCTSKYASALQWEEKKLANIHKKQN